jgi:hypothetical protein
LSWLRPHPDGRLVATGTRVLNPEVWVMENFLPVAKGKPAPSTRAIRK